MGAPLAVAYRVELETRESAAVDPSASVTRETPKQAARVRTTGETVLGAAPNRANDAKRTGLMELLIGQQWLIALKQD